MADWPDTKIPMIRTVSELVLHLRRIVGERSRDRFVASTSEMSRFENEILATSENLRNLTDVCGRWVDQVADRIPMKQLTLDMDSSESPTYG